MTDQGASYNAISEITRLKEENRQLREDKKELLAELYSLAFDEGILGKHGALSVTASRIEKLEAALRKIADIEHEDLPKPVGAAEGTLWVILAGCVEVAEKALEGEDV